MSILNLDDWEDNWQVELHTALMAFGKDPCEGTHDVIRSICREHCDVHASETVGPNDIVIAVCNDTRKRDAVGIQGPEPNPGYYRGRVKCWKCSRHTPVARRSMWITRTMNDGGRYIKNGICFRRTHEVYDLPRDVYDTLLNTLEHE